MTKKVGRNDPCPCGSQKKYKQCCWKKHQGGTKFSAKKISATGGVVGDVFSNLTTTMESLKDRVKKQDPKK